MGMDFKKGIFIVGVLFLSMVLSACGSITIDLNKYLNITYDGFDGFGQSIVTVNFEQIAEDYHKDIDDSAIPNGLTNQEYVKKVLSENVTVGVDNSQSLSNGDDINISWLLDDQTALEDKLGVKFTYESVQSDVSGLPAIELFDGFSGVEVSFSGVSPQGDALIEAEQSEIPVEHITLDNVDGLANGDVVTATIHPDYISELALTEGRTPNVATKTFVVDGLAQYVSKLNEIPEDVLLKMDKQARKVIDDHIRKDWDEPERFTDATPLGQYILVKKDGVTSYADMNRVGLVYQMNTSEFYAYYWAIEFYDLLMDDGTVVVNVDNYNESKQTFKHEDDRFVGYASLDDVLEDLVEQHSDAYHYDTTIY